MNDASSHSQEIDPVFLCGDPNLFRRGVVPLGQELLTGRPLLMSADEACRHLLVVGTTGSGKTELLTGMAAGVILAGGGVIFVDGKGDLSNWGRMAGLAAQAGRADEAFLINLGGGLSSSWNPFTGLTADEAARLLISSQPVERGENAMWQQRANALLRVACRLAWWACEYDQGTPPRPSDVERWMDAKLLFFVEREYPNIPSHLKESLNGYLNTLPGYDASLHLMQGHVTREQHGYLTMQWTATFDYLCREAGHVLNTAYGDVTAEDAIRRRRIVHVSLPVLTMGGSDVKLVGGLVFSAIRRAVANMTPSVASGEWSEVVPTEGATSHLPPMLIILDEVGHYLVDGMGLMAAQARSTGVGLIFSVQDLDSMYASDPRECPLILANCGTRILMRQAGQPSDLTRKTMRSRRQTAAGLQRTVVRAAQRGLRHDAMLRLHDARRFGTNVSGRDHDQKLARLHDQQVAEGEVFLERLNDDPEWDMEDIVMSLGAGDFIAVRGNSHVVGRAHHATPAIPRVRISVPEGETVPPATPLEVLAETMSPPPGWFPLHEGDTPPVRNQNDTAYQQEKPMTEPPSRERWARVRALLS